MTIASVLWYASITGLESSPWTSPPSIKGDTRDYDTPANAAMMGPKWLEPSAIQVQELAAANWFDSSGSVNIRLADALKVAVRSKHRARF
ncbi:hypothetical protein [Psychromicrobium sp. YIM B11713]|uniref:hypothetical protein n=1 Tax=Psychromicrobium sp. YIM B11713 TaxID=3145233 RepID=UPI00374F5F5D